jgi:hypothetical protein
MQPQARSMTWLSRTMTVVLLALTVGFIPAAFASRGVAAQQPEDQEGALPADQIVNVELILDSSGSMTEATNTGEPRIDAAKRVLHEVIDAIPGDRGEQINVGLRVFGHKGDNTDGTRLTNRSINTSRSAGRQSRSPSRSPSPTSPMPPRTSPTPSSW